MLHSDLSFIFLSVLEPKVAITTESSGGPEGTFLLSLPLALHGLACQAQPFQYKPSRLEPKVT